MKNQSVRARMFLQILKNAKHGHIELLLPDGRREKYGQGDLITVVTVKDWEAIDTLFRLGDLGLAETIIHDQLEVGDLAALVEWACRNDRDLASALHGMWYGTLLLKLRHFLNRNSRTGAKKNIMTHYDLGNEFYRLWLDPSMTYSSALFNKPELTLEQAQTAKYDRILDTLNIRSGDHLLEIGCGWGGFFSHAVKVTGCKVTAVMNSPEQARHNLQKIKAEGMSSHVDLLQQDYRDIEGRYDKIVSIEMIEAVGEKYWNAYFGKIASSLKSGGTALVQGITIREDLFYSYRRQTDFIQQYVFPGGMLLANSVIKDKSNEHGLQLQNTFEFGIDYANTLKTWRQNFNRAIEDIKAMGFSDEFIRLWNLYLSYCEGAFRAQRINVGQFLLAK